VEDAIMVVRLLLIALLLCASRASADVAQVTIASRDLIAGGHAFGSAGQYERLTGAIEFALDPAAPENARIVDLALAPRAADGRVHFTATLHVLRPVDSARANGVMFFEASNRGRFGLLGRFAGGESNLDGKTAEDFGDGFLLRDGFTLVWVGWEFDVGPTLVRADAPRVVRDGKPLVAQASVRATPDKGGSELTFADAVMYAPVVDAPAELLVRTRFWDQPRTIPRDRWRFDGSTAPPVIHTSDPIEPGMNYELKFHTADTRVVGVGHAAIRDAASAFRYRDDMPVRGRSAYLFGSSQTGRFVREFLYEGFNADARGRRVFDAVWAHVAGAARGPFNERFVTPTALTPFTPTRFPYADAEYVDPISGRRDGFQNAYRPEQRPKVFYSNTSVEYWGQGRATSLLHTTPDGKADGVVPDNVRIYLLNAQHGEGAFPPRRTNGRQLNNPTSQRPVMRALFQALHEWAARSVAPPASRHPRLDDRTLTPVAALKLPALPGTRAPRGVTGPGTVTAKGYVALPFLVPQVDSDGNELAGVKVPDVAVPLATTTGWNLRGEQVGNPDELYSLLGSYIPFAKTRAEREARKDPRPSIEERYRDRDDYMARVKKAAEALVRDRLLLEEDVRDVIDRAAAHWEYATRGTTSDARPN
jgi:hypothetical protein